MNWFRTILVLTLAALWLPVSVHCQLEKIPALSFLSCGPDESAEPHHGDDCESDGCAVVESGHYMTERRLASPPAPEIVLMGFLIGLLETPVSATAPAAGPSLPDIVPSDFLPRWQFAFRAALLPRAPSLPS